MTLNFAEQAWLHAAHYNNAMDVYQTFLAKKNTKEIQTISEII